MAEQNKKKKRKRKYLRHTNWISLTTIIIIIIY